jgi:hypothetical protein
MKKLIKQILKESLVEKEYVKIFKLIDKFLSSDQFSSRDRDNLFTNENIYNSGETYDYIYEYLLNIGYNSEDSNKIIGSYILTNQHNENSGDDFKKDVVIAKPKKYVGEFTQYVSGTQTGHMTSFDEVYSMAQAMSDFKNHNYDDMNIVNDYTENDEFEIQDIWEDN